MVKSSASGGQAFGTQQYFGSGGAGGYENGGDAGKSGDEDGKAGGLGAGGGGAFSYWTENPGGQGGYPGFIIFY